MFETLDFVKSLNEDLFDEWLENGRNSRLGYHYMLVVWDKLHEQFKPLYTEDKERIEEFDNSVVSNEILVAAYDLYSESKISI